MKLGYREGVDFLSHFLKSKNNSDRTVLAICGGSCSGKSSLARDVLAQVGTKRVTLIPVDSYSKGISEQTDAIEFDSPQSYDIPLLTKHVNSITNGAVEIALPVYDAKISSRRGYSNILISNLVIIEGLYAIQPQFLEAINLPVFIDTTENIMTERRVYRSAELYGTDRVTILKKMKNVVLPNYRKNIYPLKRFASVVISNNI
ncbi:hypothetical protein KBC75_02995 [Candidatus Shapirobacteria bacterium]|nr:hypothetical protein [Candidatus Shapirobacteria bacterium]